MSTIFYLSIGHAPPEFPFILSFFLRQRNIARSPLSCSFRPVQRLIGHIWRGIRRRFCLWAWSRFLTPIRWFLLRGFLGGFIRFCFPWGGAPFLFLALRGGPAVAVFFVWGGHVFGKFLQVYVVIIAGIVGAPGFPAVSLALCSKSHFELSPWGYLGTSQRVFSSEVVFCIRADFQYVYKFLS